MKPLCYDLHDGTGRVYKNSELIPAFMLLPERLFEHVKNKEVTSISRTPRKLFYDPETIRRVESDVFLNFMYNIYAMFAWKHMNIPGRLEDYSDDDQGWCLAHHVHLWVQAMEDLRLLPDVGTLYDAWKNNLDGEIGYTSDGTLEFILELAVPYAMRREGYNVYLKIVEENRCHEDYARRLSWVKIDFYRKWYHRKGNQIATILSADVNRTYAAVRGTEVIDDGQCFEDHIWDAFDVQWFCKTLSEKDRKILELRLKKRKLQEIADQLGFKTHSAVLKRIRRIGKAFERYLGVDLGFSEPKIVESEAL